jgi:hypothetical protein
MNLGKGGAAGAFTLIRSKLYVKGRKGCVCVCVWARVFVCVQSPLSLSGGRSTSNTAEHAIAHFSGQISPFDEDILATRAQQCQ